MFDYNSGLLYSVLKQLLHVYLMSNAKGSFKYPFAMFKAYLTKENFFKRNKEKRIYCRLFMKSFCTALQGWGGG